MSWIPDFRSVSPTFVVNSTANISPKFVFVSIDKPEDIRDPKRQKAIRRHARRGKEREARRRDDVGFVHEFPVANMAAESTNSDQSSGHLEKVKHLVQAHENPRTNDAQFPNPPSPKALEFVSLDFLRPIGNGRGYNPLAPFPIKTTPRVIQLVDYLLVDARQNYQQMRTVWLTIALTDSSAFHLTLANAALFLHSDRTGAYLRESPESMKYYTISVRSVEKRLQDLQDNTSEGVIGSILGFACHDYLVGNFTRWEVHMSGLEKIIRVRGGVETLTASHLLRLTIFWIDVTGSLVMDSCPRFPPPSYLIGEIDTLDLPPLLHITLYRWDFTFPRLTDISTALSSLAKLASYVNKSASNPLIWKDEMFVAHRIYPVAHEILSLTRYTIPAEQKSSTQGIVLREVIRLSLLLVTGIMKRECGVYPDGIVQNSGRVSKLLKMYPMDWSAFMELRLWALVILALVEENDERAWCLTEIAWTMKELNLYLWYQALEVLKGIIWVEEGMTSRSESLRQEIELFLSSS